MSLFSKRDDHGFSMVEAVVSTGIISIIATILFTNQATSTDGVVLNNIVDNFALAITQSQNYSLSVRDAGGVTLFRGSYGISAGVYTGGGSTTTYTFYANKDGNRKYNGSSSSEVVESFAIPNGYSISNVCAVTGTVTCGLGGVDVLFLRPNTNAAQFTFYDVTGILSGLSGTSASVSAAIITFTSPKGNNRNITIYNTGQVAIQ